MEFFCYHRDRQGSTRLRDQMVEQHWLYMDQFADAMIARGPTFLADGTLTGSVHIVDLPDSLAAREFAFMEPGYQAGAYRDVMLRRWANCLGTTMWDFVSSGDTDLDRYLVLGYHLEPASGSATIAAVTAIARDLIACGKLLSDDGTLSLGAAVLLEAPSAQDARAVLSDDKYVGVEVHQWDFGGRSS